MWACAEEGRFANRPYEEGLWGSWRGMGPRLREDTGRERDGSPHARGHGEGEGWVPACARTRGGRGMGPRMREDTGRERDGSPHARGHGEGEGWVPACARTRGGRGMGPRMREDTGRERDGSPHARGHGEGEGIGYWEVGSWGRVFTPIQTFPRRGGRVGRGERCVLVGG